MNLTALLFFCDRFRRQLEAGTTNTAALFVYEFTAALTGQEADAADGGSIISGIPDVYTISGIVIIGAAAVLAAIGFSVFFWGVLQKKIVLKRTYW